MYFKVFVKITGPLNTENYWAQFVLFCVLGYIIIIFIIITKSSLGDIVWFGNKSQ